MMLAQTPAQARAQMQALARPAGFVPTMGALHAGHLKVIDRARAECASVVASIFVNPLQFGPGEDYERYPRDVERDRELLASHGADLLYAPDARSMYPPGFSTFVDPGPIGERFEGAIRPLHFRGVATVVTKLLHAIAPDVLYLGQKDAQQLAVLRHVARDLDFAVRVEAVETAREEDGLALSSRNAYLSADERAAAPGLYLALRQFVAAVRARTPVPHARASAQTSLEAPGVWEYLELVDGRTFEPIASPRPDALAIAAARFGATRLIDNLQAEP